MKKNRACRFCGEISRNVEKNDQCKNHKCGKYLAFIFVPKHPESKEGE